MNEFFNEKKKREDSSNRKQVPEIKFLVDKLCTLLETALTKAELNKRIRINISKFS